MSEMMENAAVAIIRAQRMVIQRLSGELAEARAKVYAWLLDEVQHIGDWDGITDQERKELADLMMTRCPLAAAKDGER